MKLYRIILKEKNGTRIVRRWATSEEEIRKDVKRLLPLSTIMNIIEVTADTLIVNK